MKLITEILENFANNREIIFKVKVFPKSGREAIGGQTADKCLKIYLNTLPENNQANLALIKFLANELNLRRYQITILSGQKDSIKTIKISR
jgi:uncharacterized protein (TIGR00251 family)